MATANERQVGGGHYKARIEHWDYVIANEIPYLEAQIIKYLTRWRKKNGITDLRKAQHFLQKLFETEGIDWSEAQPGDVTSPTKYRADVRLPTERQGQGAGTDQVVGGPIPPMARAIAEEYRDSPFEIGGLPGR